LSLTSDNKKISIPHFMRIFLALSLVMINKLLLFLFLTLLNHSLLAKPIVDVRRVDFRKTQQYWIQMEVQLQCGSNFSSDAKDQDYIENVKAKVYLAYARDTTTAVYDYYCSEVEIVIMEANEDYNLYFYLPGLIAERDQLNQPDPAFYYVELSVAGVALAPQAGSAAISAKIANSQVLQSFISKANQESVVNEFALMPIYHVPAQFRSRVEKLPLFLRRDVRD